MIKNDKKGQKGQKTKIMIKLSTNTFCDEGSFKRLRLLREFL